MFTKIFGIFALIGVWCFPAHARTIPFGNKEQRQADLHQIHPVLGVGGLGKDTIHPRLEIRELERNKDQFNVYLLGLQRLQNIPQDDKLSYYRISGIHGRPFIPWDGVAKHPEGRFGYCAHGSNLFPTWHRPYLALIEELVYSNAQQAISEFPAGGVKDRLYDALSTFRLPYWDAAAIPPVDTSSFPAIVQARFVEMEVPSGGTTTKITIPNPLYAYAFHPIPLDDFQIDGESVSANDPWIHWTSTKRFPTNATDTAESQDNLVAESLDRNRENMMQRTYQMLGMQTEYLDVSNNMVESRAEGGIPDSLESIHDTLHNAIGRGGHMYDAAYSAFDPMFWLLHANVDRLLALWQGLHPDSYVESHINPWPTFATPAKTEADENTPLYPFHRNESGEFWTSASVRDHTVFGSTYPEFLGLTATDTLVGRVKALYGPDATSRFSWEDTGTMQNVAGTQVGKVQYQYFANVRIHRAGAGGVFKVFVFLDADVGTISASSDTQKWISESGFVGYTGFQQNVANDGEMDGPEMHGVVALTVALESRLWVDELDSMDVTTVGAYLREKLTWMLVDANDNVVALNTPEYTVEVLWTKVATGTSNSFPKVLESGSEPLTHVVMEKVGVV